MSDISWTVELPKKKQAVLGQAKPKAKIILETEVGETEELFIPPTVKRKRGFLLLPLVMSFCMS